MSRSFRHSPVVKCGSDNPGTNQWSKSCAQRKLRRRIRTWLQADHESPEPLLREVSQVYDWYDYVFTHWGCDQHCFHQSWYYADRESCWVKRMPRFWGK